MKLTKEIIREISSIKNEPDWMYEFRLKAFEHFDMAKNPSWGPKIDVDFDSNPIDEDMTISHFERILEYTTGGEGCFIIKA